MRGFWRFIDSDARRRRATRPSALRLAAKMVGRWPSGAPLALAPDARRPRARRGERLRLLHEPIRVGTALPGRRARPPHEPARLARPAPGHRASRSRSTAATGSCGAAASTGTPLTPRRGARRVAGAGRRARPALHLPEREHRPPVRVRPAHLAEQPEVRRALRRRRPAHRPVGAVRRHVHDARPTGVRERVTGVPRFVTVKGGAYFFLPGLAALRYLAGIGVEPGNVLVARRLVVLDRRSSPGAAATSSSTSACARGSGCRAGGARRCECHGL